MKRILITGATGNIGQALSAYLAEKNHQLIITATKQEKLKQLANSFKPHNSHIDYVATDYADISTFAALKTLCADGLDGLVLITPRIPASINCLPENDEWESLFKLAFFNPLRLIASLIDALGLSTRAKVVIVSGLTSVQYHPQYALNGAIRAAWLAQAKAMAFQYGAQKIHFNTLTLGGIMSETFIEKLQKEAQELGVPYQQILQARVENVPLQKYASLLEVAQTIEGLLSTFSDHMTGMNFICDGGFIKAY